MENLDDSRMAPILVTGGTGTLGRHVVAGLVETGRTVRVLSRGHLERAPTPGETVEHVTVDLSTGEGIDAAVDGTEVVIHLAGGPKGDAEKTRRLVRAASPAGVRHLVFISVVGADRIPVRSSLDRAMFGYFEQKHAAEQIVAESGLPWTTLRATQFHDLTFRTVAAMAKMPVVPVPAGWRFQPIDAGEVAHRLIELALGEPAGLVAAVGGPRIYELSDLVRSYLRATGRRRPIVPLPLPGGANRAFRDGANLVPELSVGRRTWETFLAETVGEARGVAAHTAMPKA